MTRFVFKRPGQKIATIVGRHVRTNLATGEVLVETTSGTLVRLQREWNVRQHRAI